MPKLFLVSLAFDKFSGLIPMNKNNDLIQIQNPVILLTGCINPFGMSLTTVQDPGVRKKQYIEAINYYLNNTECLIVFAENSGVDISMEFEGKSERLEILTFSGNDYSKGLGKGYGEMLIIKHALEHSKFIKQSSAICKITGRYVVLNVNSIVKAYSKYQCDLMVDLTQHLRYGDSRIFVTNKSFFLEFLIESGHLIDDSRGVYFEHVLSQSVLKSILNGALYMPLKYLPRIKGQSGTDGTMYDHSILRWLPENLKRIIYFKLFIKR